MSKTDNIIKGNKTTKNDTEYTDFSIVVGLPKEKIPFN